MHNSKKMFLALVLLISISSSAQDANPFVGTWDLDKAASNFGSAPVPSNMIRTYQDLGDGSFMYLLVTINADESIGGSSATYRYDRKEYPIASLNQNNSTTISYRRDNEKTVEYTVHVDGNPLQLGAKSISPDGRVLTIVIQNADAQSNVNNQILRFNRRR